MRHIIGIDLGGTNIVAGCVAEDGSAIHGVRSVPTGAEQGPDAVVDRIIATAQESLEEAHRIVPGLKPIGVGIGAPGPLDTRAGIVLLTPNLGWVNMPLRERMMKAMAGTEPEALLKQWLATGSQTFEQIQKAFWEQFGGKK